MNEVLEEGAPTITNAKVETLDLTPEEQTDKVAMVQPVNGTEENLYDEIDYIASEQFIRDAQARYQQEVLDAAAQLIRGEIPAEEQASITIAACRRLSEAVYQHVTLVEQLEQEEAALVEFDNNLAEQLRIMRKLEKEAKARKTELRRQQRAAQQQAELERLNNSYNANVAEIHELEANTGGPKL